MTSRSNIRSEAALQRSVMKTLQELPFFDGFKLDQRTRRGDADFIFCHRGIFGALEFKKGSKSATPAQQYFLDTITSVGGFASVVNEDNCQEVIDVIRNCALCPTCGRALYRQLEK